MASSVRYRSYGGDNKAFHSKMMPTISRSRLANSLPFSGLFRQLEREMETVVRILQPGPLGIIEHKFSAAETNQANGMVRRAADNWTRNAKLEKRKGLWGL